ncbi:tetratricopeptide repeat (TPR)-like superfamily protein [Wolffia australiana]
MGFVYSVVRSGKQVLRASSGDSLLRFFDRRLSSSSSLSALSSRSRTPLERQFEESIHRLKPGFTSEDLESTLRSQSDPDLAMDIFRWSSQQRGYRHPAPVYHAMVEISIAGRRFDQAEALIDEILSGACSNPDLRLFNDMIRFCCSKKHLFSRAFDVFKKMTRDSCRPNLETYTMLLSSVLKRFGKPSVSYVYLHAVRSLSRQMKASGVIPDTYALNLIIKAYSNCLEMDDAIKIFKEMGLYGCDPNQYTYGYLCKGLCEKGRIDDGLEFFKEMREKDLVPTKTVYSILICSLAMEKRFSEAVGVLRDSLEKALVPDLLTYRTLLESLCRDGKADEAFKLLEELRSLEGCMSQKTYSNLLDGLHWLCQ